MSKVKLSTRLIHVVIEQEQVREKFEEADLLGHRAKADELVLRFAELDLERMILLKRIRVRGAP